MKPFDDVLPEEQEARYRDLIELMQRVRRSPLPGTAAEQDQLIARVQQRLAEGAYTAKQTVGAELQEANTNMQLDENELAQVGTVRSLPDGFTRAPRATPHRKRQSGRLFTTLVAILLVGLLIGGSLMLFSRAPSDSWLGGRPVTVRATYDGLEMSLSATHGPYFLSELIGVSMTLTNPTHMTFDLLGRVTSDGGSCFGPALVASLSGGHSPHFIIPAEQFIQQFWETIHCPGPGRSNVQPGQTVTILQYVPIESSGQVTLRVSAAFAPANSSNMQPLPFHDLTLQLHVASQVSSGHTISVQRHDTDLQVAVSHGAHPQLAYIYAVDHADPGVCGPSWWQPAPTNALHIPLCQNGHWAYAVGAVGYGIVVGAFSH